MSAETANRRSKDSVFVDIFSDVNYVFELYKELHPEDTEATVDDINIQRQICNSCRSSKRLESKYCAANDVLFV